MSIKADLKQLLKPYYIFNLLLSLSYVILKRAPVLCNYLFHVDICEFDGVRKQFFERKLPLKSLKSILYLARNWNFIFSNNRRNDSD